VYTIRSVVPPPSRRRSGTGRQGNRRIVEGEVDRMVVFRKSPFLAGKGIRSRLLDLPLHPYLLLVFPPPRDLGMRGDMVKPPFHPIHIFPIIFPHLPTPSPITLFLGWEGT
jgi:hypothetical protein